MEFVIKGMKYNTEKMEKVAEVRKWYRVDTFLTRSMYPGKEVDRTYPVSYTHLTLPTKLEV